MDKLKAIEVFVAIADAGSLTAAAQRLNVSLPSVVRTLGGLERELSTTLFNRTTRRIALTDEGRSYLEACRAGLAQLHAAEQSLLDRRSVPAGKLTITASVMFGRMHVVPLVNAFLRRHREVSVELVLLDRVVDLIEEGIDVALRIGPLPDSSLHARPIGSVRRITCASPAYLKRRSVPRGPEDLRKHDVISFRGLTAAGRFRFQVSARPIELEFTPRIVSNSIDAALQACVDGLGVGQFLSYMVQPQLRARTLHRVLAEFEPAAEPVSIVYPHSRALSSKVRAFVDQAAGYLPPRIDS